MIRVQLNGPIDLDGFRQAARRLVAAGATPDEVSWRTDEEAPTLWDAADDGLDAPGDADALTACADDAVKRSTIRVPADFLRLCQATLLNRDPQRFDLLYRLLFRLQQDGGRWDPLDPERRRAEQLAREVRHEIHKMHAFVRFVPVQDDDGERHVAWFEPEHHIVEAASPFFARRFANMRWAILSPRCSVSWDGRQLMTGPGARREQAPTPDAGAALWLTYYRSIFNPARLKIAMMEKEMPRRYWPNLPEAALIEPLIAEAAQRTQTMITADPSEPRRIRAIPAARRGAR
ncbi:TIGR03915 family putative DNA repair protein [Roseateles amylovorans]|uniref:TIGR03915 family putative DNA repair protein n=1 Tax=Roseateles amylovorans TaxID=2978473 RepID=A0ABY6B055_9BURK|nr:TIGR03915 family putative DNA repair protein [Roseateles amylovorans]UXH78548.1 TIGR03915 family putative DNA repair protein [Roseateles amylovorans]